MNLFQWEVIMIDSAVLPFQLKQLRLSTMRDVCEETAQLAEKHHWTYQQFLTILCDRELGVRSQRRIQRNIIEAKLSIGKTLDRFEFKNLSSITGAQIAAFAETTHWLEEAHNLILFGPSGVGKSHLAAAIGNRLVELGKKVHFAKTTALVQKLQLAYQEHKLQDFLEKLAKYDLLILDDIGYVKKTESETSVLFDLIADRYESKSLLITANQPFDKWDAIFPNHITTTAAIDRLVHHATIININEHSYRKAAQIASSKSTRVKSE